MFSVSTLLWSAAERLLGKGETGRIEVHVSPPLERSGTARGEKQMLGKRALSGRGLGKIFKLDFKRTQAHD